MELTHVCKLSFIFGSCTYITLALKFFQNLSSQISDNHSRLGCFDKSSSFIHRVQRFFWWTIPTLWRVVLRRVADGRSIWTSCFIVFGLFFFSCSVFPVVFFSASFYFTWFMPHKPHRTFFSVNTVTNIAIFIQLFPFWCLNF